VCSSDLALHVNDIPLDQLNYHFINEFAHYLKIVENNNQNTVAKNITLMRAIINKALDMEWIAVNPFRNFRIKKEEPPRTYLTMEEVNKVVTTPMPSRNLEIIKDCILFLIYTGVAYADLKNLKESNIITGIDGHPWIELKRQKTNSRAALPVLPPALGTIHKYANHPCRLNNHLILPVQSNQKMNKQIEKVMKVCGIEKNISTHFFRRTFATTITLSNGVPIETVSKMLGHSDLKTTQIYAKVVDSKISADMNRLIKKKDVEG
jgi:site-specific recombinase XerD